MLGAPIALPAATPGPPNSIRRARNFFEEAADKYADINGVRRPVGKKARTNYDRYLSVGRAAPQIEGADQDGKLLKLSDYKGKVVLLDFWSES